MRQGKAGEQSEKSQETGNGPPASVASRCSLEPGPSRARYFPRDMLLLTTTARERAWRLLKITNRAKGRNSTSNLHVPLWFERHQSVFTHVRWRSFLSVRLRNFSQSSLRKKNQSWNKENGVTEIRTANPSSQIVELPSRPRETWRFRSVEERRRKKKTNNCSTFRAPRTHFSTLTITPTLTLTLTLTLLKYPYPNPNPKP